MNSKRYTVLIADDHPIVLSGLAATLGTKEAFDVVATCADGPEALAGLRSLEPDLGVLDIGMPGLTGIEVLSVSEGEGLRTRLVFLTASATDEQITQAVARGAWGIMIKDAAADMLVECLEQVANGQRWLPPELVSPALEREAERRNDINRIDSLLTAREREIAILVAEGLSNKQIAGQISITEGTVKIHLHNAYQKLGVVNRTSLGVLAQRYFGNRP